MVEQNREYTRRKSDRLSQNIIAVLGRMIFAAVFVLSAINNMFHFSQLASELTEHTLIANSGLLLSLGIIFQLAGGLLVFLGLYTRVGALLLFMFLVPLTVMYHPFWMYSEPLQLSAQLQSFMKSLALSGAALYIVAFGGGHVSIDWWLRKKD